MTFRVYAAGTGLSSSIMPGQSMAAMPLMIIKRLGMQAPCREIATASLVCKEFALASEGAWAALKEHCPPRIPKHQPGLHSWHRSGEAGPLAAPMASNDLVEQPQHLSVPELKGLCRSLCIPVSGKALCLAWRPPL